MRMIGLWYTVPFGFHTDGDVHLMHLHSLAEGASLYLILEEADPPKPGPIWSTTRNVSKLDLGPSSAVLHTVPPFGTWG